jgi:hypothetical protein
MTPTVRARIVEAPPAYQGAGGYEMEWSEEESTTTTWGHENAQPALRYATSLLNREPQSAAPSARSDQVHVVRYEPPPPPAPTPVPSFHVEAPRPHFVRAPLIDDELEPAIGTERALGALVWTVFGAAGLFCALLFMRLVVSDATSDTHKSVEPAAVPSAPIPAAAPSAPAPQVQEVAVPQPAAPAIAAKPEPAPQPAAIVAAAKVAAPKHAPQVIAPKHASPRHAQPLRAPKPAPVKRMATPAPKPEKHAVHVEPAAPAPHAMGTLRVNSLPWSEVFVDGKLVGNTPQMGLPLPAGHHKIKLVNAPLEMTKVFSVEIAPGQVLTKTVNLSQ